MMKVMDVAEANEGRLMELSQKTVDDFKEMDRTRCSFHAPKEKRRTTYAYLNDLDSRTGADRSVVYDRVTHTVSQGGLTFQHPRRQKHHADVETRGGRL